MGLIRNLFRKAQDLDFQDRRIVLLEGEVQHLQNKLALTEKACESARTSENKTLRRHADMMSQKAGLTPVFVKDAEPVKAPEPDKEVEDRIEWLATMQKQQDDDAGLDPRPLEFYKDLVRNEGPDTLII